MLIETALIGSSLISGVAGILGGIFGGKSAKKAAKAQAGAADRATEAQLLMWRKGREDMLPWLETGGAATRQLADLMGLETPGQEKSERFGELSEFIDPAAFKESPGYRFQLEEGEKAINRMASATGSFFSGERGKELVGYAGGMASREYGNWFARQRAERGDIYNRLAGISSQGQAGAAGTAAAGVATGQGVAATERYAGEAEARGYLRRGEAQASTYAGIANAATSYAENRMFMNMMKNSTKYPKIGSVAPDFYNV